MSSTPFSSEQRKPSKHETGNRVPHTDGIILSVNNLRRDSFLSKKDGLIFLCSKEQFSENLLNPILDIINPPPQGNIRCQFR